MKNGRFVVYAAYVTYVLSVAVVVAFFAPLFPYLDSICLCQSSIISENVIGEQSRAIFSLMSS